MIKKEDLDKMEPEMVEEAIQSRLKLLEQMVGSLYPSILKGELNQLYAKRAGIKIEVEKKEYRVVNLPPNYLIGYGPDNEFSTVATTLSSYRANQIARLLNKDEQGE